MRTKRDVNGNEMRQGDVILCPHEFEGLPAGVTGTVYLRNPLDETQEFLTRSGYVMVVLDPPWDRDFGYNSDSWIGDVPADCVGKQYKLTPYNCQIVTALSNEKYTEEDNELYE